MHKEKEKEVGYFLYFIRSLKNGKVYVGKTNRNPKERLKEHNRGMNRFTSQNRPFKLVYYEKYYCQKDLDEREMFYKSGMGRKIRDVILEVASATG
jgi:predicted GIY-YIG superfamily endonuclease